MPGALDTVARALRADRRAVTSIEYALLGSLIMVAIVVAITTFTGNVNTMYAHIVSSM